MPIQWKCSCGEAVTAPLESAGKSIACPGCAALLPVPAMGLLASDTSKTPKPSTPPRGWVTIGAAGGVLLAALVFLVILRFSAWVHDDYQAEAVLPVPVNPGPDPKQKAPAKKQESKKGNSPENPRPVGLPTPISRPDLSLNNKADSPLSISRSVKAKFKPAGRGANPGVSKPGPEKPAVLPTPSLASPVNKPRVIPPLQGNSRLSKTQNFVFPLEIIDIKNGRIPYSIRHLKLPGNFKGRQLRLAVTESKYDDMGMLLRNLGDGYPYTTIGKLDLSRPDRLQAFEVIFLTCSTETSRDAAIARTLRQYVARGGTLYASDLRLNLVQKAFPEFSANYRMAAGKAQKLNARVVNPNLRQFLGTEQILLDFESKGWMPAGFDRFRTSAFLEGNYLTEQGTVRNARLLVKFRYQKGTVIFTSFHNAGQNDVLEKKLLRFLVFSALTAKSEARVTDLMRGAGFAPRDLKNVQVSRDRETDRQSYSHAGGRLQFAVGFEPGVRLRLILTAPDGRKIEHEDAATFLVEIPNAPAGNWHYQVQAVSLPFDNYPFILAVGRPGKE